MDTYERAKLYLDKCPPAISGSDGHGQTFAVACSLINGFGLSSPDAMRLLSDYNQRCNPPWSEKELLHKVQSAEQAVHHKPRGHLVGNGATPHWSSDDYTLHSTPKPAPEAKKPPRYKTDAPVTLPEPLEDPTRRFLMAAFSAGESISIALGIKNADDRCIPADGGLTHTREEWIKQLDIKGGEASKIFPSHLCGAYVRINPVTAGGTKDADVTAFRHALVEWDHCSVEEQWNIIKASNIPCTAILHSGGKSLHAWVRVDAKDHKEYTQRVKQIYDHFSEYGLDPKNKNPSRFSRLPGMLRAGRKQDLLSLKTGAESFTQWLVDIEILSAGLRFTIADLLDYDNSNDPNCVIGRRWLCKGGACIVVGPSGVGKSSLAMQAACVWALGRPLFGVRPTKPLRSLFIQAENDIGDMSEMFKGVVGGMDIPARDIKGVADLLKENLIIVQNDSDVGMDFVAAAQKLIARYSPDLVWVDPLLAYFGDDISNQKACSVFLRNWLNPIAKATGIIWMLLHHTNKPSKDPKSKSGWTHSDFSYLGTGSAELTNWARAAMILTEVDNYAYKLLFAKRGPRAGALDIRGEPTRDVWLQHSESGIFWEQTDEPEKAEKGAPKKELDYVAFIRSLDGREWKKSEILRKACAVTGACKRKAYDFWPELESRLNHNKVANTYTP